ncbi:MAG TPA: hypothetical protein VIV11_02095 [Kofleriaceae bacterium]
MGDAQAELRRARDQLRPLLQLFDVALAALDTIIEIALVLEASVHILKRAVMVDDRGCETDLGAHDSVTHVVEPSFDGANAVGKLFDPIRDTIYACFYVRHPAGELLDMLGEPVYALVGAADLVTNAADLATNAVDLATNAVKLTTHVLETAANLLAKLDQHTDGQIIRFHKPSPFYLGWSARQPASSVPGATGRMCSRACPRSDELRTRRPRHVREQLVAVLHCSSMM